jgi:DNA ligase (NAD+)
VDPILFKIPEFCPICSSVTIIQGDFLYCKNNVCPSKLSGSLKVWIRNLGLLHWGDATIDAIISSNSIVKSVADLYRLTVADLEQYCSGPKMAAKCYEVLHSNKDLSLELILASLNIPNFGISTATDLIQAGFNTVDKILNIDYDALRAVPNIGEKTARQIQEGLLFRRELFIDLVSVINVRQAVGGILSGKTLCITGELTRPRKAVERDIMDVGGFPKSSVSKTTSYLVTNNPDTNSSKMKNARKYNVPVLSETDLYNLITIQS